MTPDVIPNKKNLGSGVIVELSPRGGHVGFIDRWVSSQKACFLSRRVTEFFDDHI